MLLIGRDALLGQIILTVTVLSFTYYSLWLVGLPFVPEPHFFRNFFPDVIYGLTVPLGTTTIIVCILACYLATLLKIMRPLIVGIGGVTNGGKTSLTRKLLAQFPFAATISQDDYFKEELPDLPRTPGLDHVNWDCFEVLDMDRMMHDLRCLISVLSAENQQRLLIIEGFLIMNYPSLAKVIDLKYFLTLTKDVCRERRNKRVYNPPDPPGNFDLCVWPMYETHYALLQSIAANSQITFLDGEGDQDLHLRKVSEDINARLNLL